MADATVHVNTCSPVEPFNLPYDTIDGKTLGTRIRQTPLFLAMYNEDDAEPILPDIHINLKQSDWLAYDLPVVNIGSLPSDLVYSMPFRLLRLSGCIRPWRVGLLFHHVCYGYCSYLPPCIQTLTIASLG